MTTIAGRLTTPVAITAPAASLTATPGAAVSAGGYDDAACPAAG